MLFYPLTSHFLSCVLVVTLCPIVALCLMSPAIAYTANVKMLPPTIMGTAMDCPGNNQLLAYSGAPLETGMVGINCVPIGTDSSGNLQAQGTVRMGTTDAPCTLPLAGTLRFNSATSIFEGCNGSAWLPLGGSGGYPVNHPAIKTVDVQLNGFGSYSCLAMTDANANIYVAIAAGGIIETAWQHTDILTYGSYAFEYGSGGGFIWGPGFGSVITCNADIKGVYITMTPNGGSVGGRFGPSPALANAFQAW